MNQRIRQLAEQAGINLPDDTDFNGHIYRNRLEIFAQLIVRECAEICLENNDHKNILRHFDLYQ